MQISASQIKTFNLCRKKWYFEKVEKLPRGETSYGATFGTVLHGVLERIHRDTEPYPPGWNALLRHGDTEIAKALVGLYTPVEGVEGIEHRIDMHVIDGINLIGYIDLYKKACIIDHKSSKALKWTLDSKELAGDLQMLIYAKWALDHEHPRPKVVELRHNLFIRTPPAKFREVVAYATAGAITEKWYQVQETALVMKETRDRGSPPEVELGDHCHAFGGCPYAHVCSGVVSLEEFKERPDPRKRESKMPSRKKIVAESGPLKGVTLYVGCVPIKREAPGRYISLDALFMEVLQAQGKSVADYAESNAFDRRDEILGAVGAWLAEVGEPVHITAPSATCLVPDEKNLVFAVRLWAGTIIEATT